MLRRTRLGIAASRQASYPRSCSVPRPPESTREPILKLPLPRRASRLRGSCPGEPTSLTQARPHQKLHKDGSTRRPYSP
ncbi:hypothetical protein HID58_095807 [Brassica napus]|uniref:Uncharacterized protein n=1 Tax=Brassica napus TaxID=3708 RepID=A0ABQ7X298_BRANA|nr:hypothetical protein HID58_095807 [Brassica napus]